MSQLTDIIHLLICRSPHEYDMLNIKSRANGCCYYYLEHDIAEGQTMPDHVQWEGITSKLKTSLALNSDKEALEFIRSAIKISQELKGLIGVNEARLNFIKGLLL